MKNKQLQYFKIIWFKEEEKKRNEHNIYSIRWHDLYISIIIDFKRYYVNHIKARKRDR